MNYYDQILKIVENNNGYVTTNEVVKNGINNIFLTNLVRSGRLVRISRGYYGISDYIEDDYYKLASKSKNARFSLATALYLHNLSDRVPLVYNITLPVGYNGSLQNEKNVLLNYVSKETLDLGTVEMMSPFGTKIKVYDVERTICDIIKYKNKIDGEIFSKALKSYVRSNTKDLNKLMKYAKKLNIENKVTHYLEILL